MALLLNTVPRCALNPVRRNSRAALDLINLVRRPPLSTAGDSPLKHNTKHGESTSADNPDSVIRYNEKDNSRFDDIDYRRWKIREEEILKDIEPITYLTKEILHSNRYMDGEHLSAEDEKEVVEKLLVYHPHSEDKIGCGLASIMVDRHPQFRNSRCLFVIRTDGVWIDFSYQKCLRAYIREKYPSYGERSVVNVRKRIKDVLDSSRAQPRA